MEALKIDNTIKGNALNAYTVSGIEWTTDKEFHFGQKMSKYLEDIVDMRHVLPIKGVEIKFLSDKWDFNPCFNLRSSSAFIFNFENVPETYKRVSKFFVLMTLMNADNKLSTVKRRFSDVKAFISHMNSSGICDVKLIANKDIKDYLNAYIGSHSPKSSCMVRVALQQFFEFVCANYSYDMNMSLSVFSDYDYLNAIEKKVREANKVPDIPEEYYDELLNVLIALMRNKTVSYNFRATACIYIIMSQTGLRITEILALMTDSLHSISVKGVEPAYYLEVQEFKPASRFEEALSFPTFANALTVEAFNTLVSMRTANGRDKGNKFIYLPSDGPIPSSSEFVLKWFHKIIYNYMPSARANKDDECPYDELRIIAVNPGSKSTKYIVSPHSKQFRVHLCTELYFKHHVSLLFIQKFMGHLSGIMQGYYIRDNRAINIREITETERLLSEIVQGKVELLGGKSSEINSNIDKFIKEGHYNVKTDLEQIVRDLDGALAIRAKRGGFCVKASMFRECSQDAQTNEIYCAYNICPNLCHVYYMAADSYEDFKTLQKTFEENAKNGFDLQASKELNKAKTVLRTRLIPELEDMQKRIKLRGLDEVLHDYPQLKEIIENYDIIQEEILEWRKKTY